MMTPKLSNELHTQLNPGAEHFSRSCPEKHLNTGLIVNCVNKNRGTVWVISSGLTVSHGLNILVVKVVRLGLDQMVAHG